MVAYACVCACVCQCVCECHGDAFDYQITLCTRCKINVFQKKAHSSLEVSTLVAGRRGVAEGYEAALSVWVAWLRQCGVAATDDAKLNRYRKICTLAHTLAHKHTHTHTHTHTRTHAHLHVHPRTHVHIHTHMVRLPVTLI